MNLFQLVYCYLQNEMILCKQSNGCDLSKSRKNERNCYMRKNTKTDKTIVHMLADHERRVEEAMKFNLLSNVFMSVALNDIPACQYVLRILTGIEDLVVKEVRSQYQISKLHSHDAILDILAEDGTGKLYNLEIQRADTIDHARRTRFYGAMIWKKGKPMQSCRMYTSSISARQICGKKDTPHILWKNVLEIPTFPMRMGCIFCM